MRDILEYSLNEDIGFADITTEYLIVSDSVSKANIVARQNCVIAGCDIACEIFKAHGLDFKLFKEDGDELSKDDIILTVEGSTSSILTLERTVLNYMMHLSGIATLSSKLNNKVKKINPNVTLAGTRKTTPGLQKFEKKAMYLAGIDTHRFKLDDCVLIKDNHISAVGSVLEALKKAKSNASFTKKIEIEVETLEDALIVANEGVDIIMLDNMSPDDIKNVIEVFKSKNLRDNFIIEASGGINEENIEEYAKTGVDVISLGLLSHSAKAVDLSLEII